MIMIDTDFSWTLRIYHNHLRSIVFVVYFLRVTQVPVAQYLPRPLLFAVRPICTAKIKLDLRQTETRCNCHD